MKPNLNQNEIKYNIEQLEQQTQIYSFNIDLLPGPPTLQGATFTNVSNKLYIYGGKNALINKYLFELNLENWVWQRLPLAGIQQQVGRVGHAACQINQNIYIFGGENRYNSSLKIRECNSELLAYDTNKKEWTQIKTFNAPPPRRNFACCQIANKYIMIYGGLSPYGTYLNDTWFLNLDSQTWECLEVENDIDGQKGIAFNTLQYIPKGDYKINSLILTLPDLRKEQILNRVKEEGVYSFGGKKANNESSQILKLMKIGQGSLKWMVLQTKGKSPIQRYNHTMNFQDFSQMLIIHGGFSDLTQRPLNDIHCLNVQNLSWSQLVIQGSPVYHRFGHCAQVVNSCLIVFGGYDLEKHKSAQIQVFELDQLKVKLRQTQQILSNAPIYRYQKQFNLQNRVESQFLNENDEDRCEEKYPESKIQINQQQQKDFISFLPIPQKIELRLQTDQYYRQNF